MDQLGCAELKTEKLLTELEKKAELIKRKCHGLGKPNLIYVKNFVDNPVDRTSPLRESQTNDTEKTKDIILNGLPAPLHVRRFPIRKNDAAKARKSVFTASQWLS